MTSAESRSEMIAHHKTKFPAPELNKLSPRQLEFFNTYKNILEAEHNLHPGKFAYDGQHIPSVAFKMTVALTRTSGSLGPLVRQALKAHGAPATYAGAMQWMKGEI